MKNLKPKKQGKGFIYEDNENTGDRKKVKKTNVNSGKINVKSKRFWNEVYDDEGDEVEKYIR